MKLSSLFILFFLAPLFLYSQNTTSNGFVLYEENDFFHDLEQEKFFLHTNKTTYFSGESIWWKAYVVNDFNNKPSNNTSNLYINFYDENKKLISNQLFFCENGKANGEITLPNTLSSGEYYIHVDTQWNKNFNNKYTVAVQVINSSEKKAVNKELKQDSISDIRLEFYPEAGNLINNTQNTVFTILQNEYGFLEDQLITILDKSTNKKVANIKTNSVGHASFSLPFYANHDYIAIVNYKKDTLTKKLPEASNTGVIVHKKMDLNNKTTQDFVVKFSDDLLEEYNKQTFFATIHRNHKLQFVLPFVIDKKHSNYVLPIAKKDLLTGFNSITIFNSKNEPIVDRPFFNQTSKNINLDVVSNKTSKDSLSFNIQLKDVFKSSNVSISVLPTETKLNENARNIKDAFFVEPYVNSLLPSNSLSNKELDMWLQTQSKKKVKHTFNTTPIIYPLERGLIVKGTVNTRVQSGYKVLLSSKENEILEVVPLESGKTFEFANLILKDSSNYKLALLNEKGVLVEAGFYVNKYNENYKPDDVLEYTKKEFSVVKEIAQEEQTPSYLGYKDAEMLDEVVVNGKKEKEEPIEDLYPNTPNELGNGFNRNLPIDEHERLTLTIIGFLNMQPGLRASEDPMGVNIRFDRAKNTTFYGDGSPMILIDGLVSSGENITYRSLNDVASIKINPSGAAYGMQASAGVISITLKDGSENRESGPNPNYFIGTTDFGFTTSAPVFKSSQFMFNSLEVQGFYETLDWIPNFNVLPNNSNTLRVYKGKHENITLFINGMSDDGQLIYKTIQIPIKAGL